MKSLSEKFVVILLLLQPCVVVPQPVEIGQLQFGDIITFPVCGHLYEHYAVFVDDDARINKPEGTNIFEKTRNPNGCQFGTVNRQNVNRKNYLDNDIQHQNEEEIIATIQRLMADPAECGRWTIVNNCEHIATAVRYGEAHSQCNQQGTLAGYCSFLFKHRRQRRSEESGNLHQGETDDEAA